MYNDLHDYESYYILERKKKDFLTIHICNTLGLTIEFSS